MRRRQPLSVRTLLVATAAALAAGGAGIATGAIPDSSSKITACYTKLGGVMRVIDTEKTPPQRCVASLETQLVLNEKGPAGPKGEPGPKGDTGAQGEPGPIGVHIHRVRHTVDVPPGATVLVGAECPANMQLLSGSHTINEWLTITDEGPGSDTSWAYRATNPTAEPGLARATARCIEVAAVTSEDQ